MENRKVKQHKTNCLGFERTMKVKASVLIPANRAGPTVFQIEKVQKL